MGVVSTQVLSGLENVEGCGSEDEELQKWEEDQELDHRLPEG